MFFWQINVRRFHHTAALESGDSEFQKMILPFFSAYFQKLPHKNNEYRNSKNFYKEDLLHKIDFETIYKNKDNKLDILINNFRMLLDKHASIKDKKITGNYDPFM